GKDILEITCGNSTFTIAVPRGEDAFGAAQVVGQKGHGIPVSLVFSVFDITTNTPLVSESTAVGQGNAHPNQPDYELHGCVLRGHRGRFLRERAASAGSRADRHHPGQPHGCRHSEALATEITEGAPAMRLWQALPWAKQGLSGGSLH